MRDCCEATTAASTPFTATVLFAVTVPLTTSTGRLVEAPFSGLSTLKASRLTAAA